MVLRYPCRSLLCLGVVLLTLLYSVLLGGWWSNSPYLTVHKHWTNLSTVHVSEDKPRRTTVVTTPTSLMGRPGIFTTITAPRINLTSSTSSTKRPESTNNTLPPNRGLPVHIPQVRVANVDCAKLFHGDKGEEKRAKGTAVTPPPKNYFTNLSQIAETSCDQYKHLRGYITSPLSEEEEKFPIAYSLVIFKDLDWAERLLRAIYRPQNYYCVHLDQKVPRDIRKALESITACFENVFLASKTTDVRWGLFSILEPELTCMNDLWKFQTWRYLINLTGQEFPLKTNKELVNILKTYHGANDIAGSIKRRFPQRTEFVHKNGRITSEKKQPPPHNLRLTKGSVHAVMSRDFVQYILFNKVALDFREWVKDTGIPDETLFSTLNHNPQLKIPGAYKGVAEYESKPFLTRFKNWADGIFHWPCAGKRVRLVCIFGVGDLPLLQSRPELFANKFNSDFQPLAYDCMEELHYNRTRDDILGVRTLNMTVYEKADFVKNHVK